MDMMGLADCQSISQAALRTTQILLGGMKKSLDTRCRNLAYGPLRSRYGYTSDIKYVFLQLRICTWFLSNEILNQTFTQDKTPKDFPIQLFTHYS